MWIVDEANEDQESSLLDAYERATAEYSKRTAKLSRLRWSLPQAVYLLIFNESEQARIKCEAARLALERFKQG